MQHAVVGTDVDHRRAARVGRLEGRVAGVEVVGERRLHVDRRRIDDVAEHGMAEDASSRVRNSPVSESATNPSVPRWPRRKFTSAPGAFAACCCAGGGIPVPSVMYGYWLSRVTLAASTERHLAGVEVGDQRPGGTPPGQMSVCQVNWPSGHWRRA